jgi:hypothetical protein
MSTRELGDGAYDRARRGEREATDAQTAAYWRRVAFIIANRTGQGRLTSQGSCAGGVSPLGRRGISRREAHLGSYP